MILPAVFRSTLPEDRAPLGRAAGHRSPGRGVDARYIPTVDDIVEAVARRSRAGDLVVVMSNGGFDDIHQKLLTALEARGGLNAARDSCGSLPAGDSALLVSCPQRIDPAINARRVALADAVADRCGASLRDVVVGYCTVTVYFDPLRSTPTGSRRSSARRGRCAEHGDRRQRRRSTSRSAMAAMIGPDLEDVAAFGGCSVEDVDRAALRRPTGCTWSASCRGSPTWPRSIRALRAPRRATPRDAVPAGSVAIAGGQTGIYPEVTPGGWNIIGRTPLKPYDPDRQDPFLFKVGDDVRFTPSPRGRSNGARE